MTGSVETAARYELVVTAGTAAPWFTMVHGVSQDRRVFDRQVEAFRRDFRICLIDLPGHGLSSDLAGPYGLAEYAASIAGAWRSAGIERSGFWGSHTGAGAGLLLACRQPRSFASLVLEGPVFPGRPPQIAVEILTAVGAVAKADGMDAAREAWWQNSDWFAVMRARPDECRAAEHRAIIDDFEGKPWLESGLISRPLAAIDGRLAALDVPVMIINGEHDLADFIAAADGLEALLPNCRRFVVPDAGGFPLWEFPDRVNDVVRAFLAP